jgi:hypothetical protein
VDPEASEPQRCKRLRAIHLIDKVTVDIDQAGAVRPLIDQVVIPDHVVKGTRP